MKDFSLIFKGMMIGVANIIPGLSGGTVAFILGIYSKLTEAVGYFLIKPEKRKEYFVFLIQIGIGAVLGLLLFAKLITVLLGINLPENSPLPFSYVPTFGFFLGLIIGSLYTLFKIQKDTKISFIRILLTIAGISLLFGLLLLKPAQTTTLNNIETLIKDFGIFKITSLSVSRSIWLFSVGIITAFTMVIPGISGSALLVALGEYGPILNYISERSIIPIGLIGMGVVIGIISAGLMMTKLLEKRSGDVFYFILGLVSASCIQLTFYMVEAGASTYTWICAAGTIGLGILLALQSAKFNSQS
ncbi:MAG: DUF368 domain-containing protein [Brevinemataceae bacterium]